jgi:hypothetical protein
MADSQTMIIYLTQEASGLLRVTVPAEGPDGLTGDLTRLIKPGEQFLGRPFEHWQQLGQGRHKVPIGAQEGPHA